MTKLDCNVVNCSYNADNCCKRGDIHVEGIQAKTPSETCCGSFAPKGCGCGSNSTQEAKKDTNVMPVSAGLMKVKNVLRDISELQEGMQTAAGRQNAEAFHATAKLQRGWQKSIPFECFM